MFQNLIFGSFSFIVFLSKKIPAPFSPFSIYLFIALHFPLPFRPSFVPVLLAHVI
jgi:hypothetical protein